MSDRRESATLDENELTVAFESHQQEFGLDDLRMCVFDPIEYFAPETQKAWEIFKAGARAQHRS